MEKEKKTMFQEAGYYSGDDIPEDNSAEVTSANFKGQYTDPNHANAPSGVAIAPSMAHVPNGVVMNDPQAQLDQNAANAVDQNQVQVDQNGNPIDPNQMAVDQFGNPIDPTMMQPSPIQNKYRNVKLFDLFTQMQTNLDDFIKVYSGIDPDELSVRDYQQIMDNSNQARTLKNDLAFYISKAFDELDYQKNLYTYLLFEKLFVKIVANFRRIAHLDTDYQFNAEN
jgi:hypothetical protein